MTYLKLWWFAYWARYWGGRLEDGQIEVTMAEVNMEHYRREWARLHDAAKAYQTPSEREKALRARVYGAPSETP